MTLDGAIKHAEEVAEENQRVVDTGIVYDDVTIDMLYCDDTEVIEEHLANYQRCAEEHRQLAEWLKELKQLREQTKWIPVSERLPEIQRGVLLELRNGDILTGFKSEIEPYFYVIGVDECYVEPINVIAWMPLPKPYEPQERSDKE